MPEQLPDGWSKRTVGDLFEMQLGKMLSKQASSGPYQAPYLANRHVQWDRVALDAMDTMSFSAEERLKYALAPGDLLVCEGGEVGRTAIWYGERPDVFFQKAIHRLRPRTKDIEPAYMLRFMRFAAERGLFTDLSSQTSIAHLTQEKLAFLRVVTPPVEEQQRIAEILDTIDEAIRKTEEIIAKLKQVKQGLLHDLLTRGIDDNGELRDPDRHPEQFKDSPLGRIPASWALSTVSGEFDVTSGMTLGPHRRPQRYPWPYLRVANVHRDRLLLDDVAMIEARPSELVGRQLAPGDLLVVEGHANPAEIGRCAMATHSVEGFTFQNHLFRLRPFRMVAEYALHWLNSSWARAYWEREASTSSGLNTINRSKLGRMLVAIPSEEEQRRIVKVASTLVAREEAEAAGLEKLMLIKQGLMEDLLTGRVRVTPLLADSEAEQAP